ncbi:MAG: hypothetical protein NVS3B1_21880 [Marmoricola sp.]
MSNTQRDGRETGLDRLLDRSVVGGYTNIGYHLRRRRWASDPAPGALRERHVLITGAGSGLGEAAALEAARLGAVVHLLGRSIDRVAPAAERIRAALGDPSAVDRLVLESCDVSDLTRVRSFAADLEARLDGSGLFAIVHNAGTLPAERTESAQGHELTMATHVLGPILLTDLLAPSLKRSESRARVVFVSSGGMYAQDLPADDPEYLRGTYRGAVAYARSKRTQVELLPVLADRWSEYAAIYGMHPGWADTPGVAASLPLFRAVTKPFLRTPQQGADTIGWLLATQPAPATATFWHDRAMRPPHYLGTHRPEPRDVDRIWDWVRLASTLRG